MKKFVYLCCLILLSTNAMAQIDLNDRNWDILFIEDFSGNRWWSNLWEDKKDDPNYQSIWKCFSDESWGDGVTIQDRITNRIKNHHAYQKQNAVFNANNSTLRLIAEFKSSNPLMCNEGYSRAPWYKYCHYCDTFPYYHPKVYYHSAMIETIDPIGFGYYEIECKMPIRAGFCSSFWFWSALGGTYNEIDVFEHNRALCPNNLERETLSGIWYNPLGTNYHVVEDSLGNTIVPRAQRHAEYRNFIDNSFDNLEEYHRFGCLWMPERVVWYVDGKAIYECDNSNHIPQFPMWLKITQWVDLYANSGSETEPIWWQAPEEMTVNYVKAYFLRSDCETDVTINSISDFNSFDYSVKKSITMGSPNGTLTIPNGSNFTMRAVDSIVIDRGFEILQGSSMTLITQPCPQCSMEGVVLPQHNCGLDGLIEEEMNP